MRVQLEELRRAFDCVSDYMEKLGKTEFEIRHDFYWDAPWSELCETRRAPAMIEVGQLSHDLERVREIATGDMPPVRDAYVWLVALLREVGEDSDG